MRGVKVSQAMHNKNAVFSKMKAINRAHSQLGVLNQKVTHTLMFIHIRRVDASSSSISSRCHHPC